MLPMTKRDAESYFKRQYSTKGNKNKELGHFNFRISGKFMEDWVDGNTGFTWQEKIEISSTKVYNANGVTFIQNLNHQNGSRPYIVRFNKGWLSQDFCMMQT
ncbi:MAG: hypothetical protein ACYC2T_11945 [Bacillota bacterium]